MYLSYSQNVSRVRDFGMAFPPGAIKLSSFSHDVLTKQFHLHYTCMHLVWFFELYYYVRNIINKFRTPSFMFPIINTSTTISTNTIIYYK